MADTVFAEPLISVALAGVTFVFSAGALTIGRKHTNYFFALSAYALLTLTIGTLVCMTGGTHSPFVALWLLAGVFAGLFGTRVLVAIAILTTAYIGYWLFAAPAFNGGELALLLLVAETPLLASYIIWHKQAKDEGAGSNSAFSALSQQLSQVSTKSEIVINSIADGVIAIDQNGIVQLINPAAQTLLGWPKQDAMGLDYRSVIKLTNQKGEEISDGLSPIRQVMLTNKALNNNDLTLISKSGKKVLVSLAVSPVSANEGANAGAIVVFRDITHEKTEERQKGEFISTAAHEMRTPVAAIEGYLGLAMNPQTATIDDKAKLYLQKAHESTQHLGRLFQDLLTVSRAEDARLVVRPTAIDTTNFTREVVESLQPKAQAKGLTLFFKPGGEGIVQPSFYMHADPDNMREVISNLIDNAIKYTKQGTVTVDVTGDEQNVTVGVTDSGIGIPPEDVPHLFQKFYRVDNSDTREIGGTGLGLFICRRLTEANNGHIGVVSTYGKGSTFSVQLPRLSHDQAATMLSAPAAGQLATPGLTSAPLGQTAAATPIIPPQSISS